MPLRAQTEPHSRIFVPAGSSVLTGCPCNPIIGGSSKTRLYRQPVSPAGQTGWDTNGYRASGRWHRSASQWQKARSTDIGGHGEMKVLAVDHCSKRADQQGTDLYAAAGLGFDDPLPEPGEAKSKTLDTALAHRPGLISRRPRPQVAGIFSGSGRSRRPHQRERTDVPSALRLSIAAMPMNRPPAPPSRFNTIVESTKFFVTP